MPERVRPAAKPIIRALLSGMLIGVLVLTGSTASASGTTLLSGPMPQLSAPSALPPGYTPAPTPHSDITAPTGPQTPSNEARFGASLGKSRTTRPGDGFSRGATFSDDLERRNRSSLNLSPSLNMTVPLTAK